MRQCGFAKQKRQTVVSSELATLASRVAKQNAFIRRGRGGMVGHYKTS